MTTKPVPAAPIVSALRAFAAAPESGLSPDQRGACDRFAYLLDAQTYVDAGAIGDLWFEARANRLISGVAEHTFRALAAASMPADFADAAMRLCGYLEHATAKHEACAAICDAIEQEHHAAMLAAGEDHDRGRDARLRADVARACAAAIRART